MPRTAEFRGETPSENGIGIDAFVVIIPQDTKAYVGAVRGDGRQTRVGVLFESVPTGLLKRPQAHYEISRTAQRS